MRTAPDVELNQRYEVTTKSGHFLGRCVGVTRVNGAVSRIHFVREHGLRHSVDPAVLVEITELQSQEGAA